MPNATGKDAALQNTRGSATIKDHSGSQCTVARNMKSPKKPRHQLETMNVGDKDAAIKNMMRSSADGSSAHFKCKCFRFRAIMQTRNHGRDKQCVTLNGCNWHVWQNAWLVFGINSAENLLESMSGLPLHSLGHKRKQKSNCQPRQSG